MIKTNVKREKKKEYSYAGQPVTRGQRNIRWIEEYCKVPEGILVAKPVRLAEFQKDLILDIYDNTTKTRQAIISFGRKNGKTGLASFLLLLHLCGPEAVVNSSLYSTAMSRKQAAQTFDYASKCVMLSPQLSAVCKIVKNEIRCPRLGTTYAALAAEATNALGLSPAFVIHDELGAVKGDRAKMYDAVESGMTAWEQPLSIIISTQSETDSDLLSVLIDTAIENEMPNKIVRLFTADPDMDPFSEEAIRAANPAFDSFQNQTELFDRRDHAKIMPSAEADYRNKTLNQRISRDTPFVTPAIWKENNTKPKSWQRRGLYGGLDLSSTTDMSSFVALSENEDDTYSAHSWAWLPDDNLADRAHTDRVPYDVWKKQGHLTTTPGKSIEYDYIAHQLYEIHEKATLERIAFDQYNFKFLRPELVRAGFSDKELDSIFIPFRQGFISFSPAIRRLESLLVNARLCHGDNPILTMAIRNVKVVEDAARNRKFVKSAHNARIDPAVSLAMAAAMLDNREEKKQEASYLAHSPMLFLEY